MFSIILLAAVQGLACSSAQMAGFEVLNVDRTLSSYGRVRINWKK